MSVADALGFLREARRDETLIDEIDALDGETSWQAFVAIAARSGFTFTTEELQQAHALDWKLRWVRYGGAR